MGSKDDDFTIEICTFEETNHIAPLRISTGPSGISKHVAGPGGIFMLGANQIHIHRLLLNFEAELIQLAIDERGGPCIASSGEEARRIQLHEALQLCSVTCFGDSTNGRF